MAMVTTRLAPGREMDALVAVKVMGWENVQAAAYTPFGRDVCGTDPTHEGGWDGNGRKPLPHYSTAIPSAWAVVEHLGLSVINSNGKWYAGRFDGGLWDHGPIDGDLRPDPQDSAADTASEAICRAALILSGQLDVIGASTY